MHLLTAPLQSQKTAPFFVAVFNTWPWGFLTTKQEREQSCDKKCSLSLSASRSVVSDSLWPHGLYSPWNSPGQNTRVGSLFPGIKPRSPTLQADSLPTEPQGKSKNTGVGSLSFLQVIFPTQESNWGLLHCTQILYQLSYQGSQLSQRDTIQENSTKPFFRRQFSKSKCHNNLPIWFKLSKRNINK